MSSLSESIQIPGYTVGQGQPALVVAEIGLAHDGSLGAAHAYVDAVAGTGVQAIKFQTHLAAAESTAAEPFRVKFSPQDATRYQYWERTSFTEDQWRGLVRHCAEKDLVFLSSPFSIEAVEMLDRLGVCAWKVASGELASLPMLEAMARTGKPILLSSGMSALSELDAAVACVRQRGVPLAVFQCTTAYPCAPEDVGLNMLDEFRRRYGCPVGLSDHSGTIYAALAAVALGAELIEVHVTFSRECFGPDVPASITTAELRQMVEGIRFIETALAHPVDKDRVAESMAPLRQTFNKSVAACGNLPAGHRLRLHDLGLRKPGTGIPAPKMTSLVGRVLRRAAAANTLLAEDNLE